MALRVVVTTIDANYENIVRIGDSVPYAAVLTGVDAQYRVYSGAGVMHGQADLTEDERRDFEALCDRIAVRLAGEMERP